APLNPVPAAGPIKKTLGANVPLDVRRWEPSILKYAQQNGINPNLVAAMMMTESQGNPEALSSRGAVGLMQVVDGPSDPEANIALGATIIASNLQRYSGNVELSLAAYNAGAGAVDQFGGVPPFLETETYVYLVLNRYYLYQSSGS
ncbi:MAG TPA: lytic transglycosylase domain-containing protein, partial [Chloroflexota bacterium]|nr:lytic transglycosylase domain-containing protein [Chloroflexota bacterium]